MVTVTSYSYNFYVILLALPLMLLLLRLWPGELKLCGFEKAAAAAAAAAGGRLPRHIGMTTVWRHSSTVGFGYKYAL